MKLCTGRLVFLKSPFMYSLGHPKRCETISAKDLFFKLSESFAVVGSKSKKAFCDTSDKNGANILAHCSFGHFSLCAVVSIAYKYASTSLVTPIFGMKSLALILLLSWLILI